MPFTVRFFNKFIGIFTINQLGIGFPHCFQCVGVLFLIIMVRFFRFPTMDGDSHTPWKLFRALFWRFFQLEQYSHTS